MENILELEVEGDEKEALHELGVDELGLGRDDRQRLVAILGLKRGQKSLERERAQWSVFDIYEKKAIGR